MEGTTGGEEKRFSHSHKTIVGHVYCLFIYSVRLHRVPGSEIIKTTFCLRSQKWLIVTMDIFDTMLDPQTDKENYIDFRLRLLGEPGDHHLHVNLSICQFY